MDLHFYGILDKRKDFLIQYAEWKMLRFVEEATVKGLKGKQMGEYVFFKIQQEVEKDPLFFESLHYYLVKHYDRLEKSRKAMQAFGVILLHYVKLHKKMLASVVKAMSTAPFLGPLVDFYASLADSLENAGDKLYETAKTKRISSTDFKISLLSDKRNHYDYYYLRNYYRKR